MGEKSSWSLAGHKTVSKIAFLKMYGTIHEGAFTTSAQKNSFTEVGIHYFDPDIVFKRIAKKQQKLYDDQHLNRSFRENSPTVTPNL